VVNQLVVKENNNEKRFDVVIFVNGLPLVFIELKSASDEKATLRKAYTQIQNYKKAVPSIFYYNALCVISDGIDATTSSVSAPFTRYLSWKAPKEIKGEVRTELQLLTEYMLNKKTLVELIRYCTVFEQEEKKDEKTGLISQMKNYYGSYCVTA
jgi:type I restriction enzyme R subunit